MESTEGPLREEVREGSGFTYLTRAKGTDGASITQASLTSIACKVTDVSTGVITTPTVTIAMSVFDTLQTDARWTLANPDDTTGYNFRFDIAPASIPTGGKLYEIVFTATPAVGNAYNLGLIEIFVIPIRGF